MIHRWRLHSMVSTTLLAMMVLCCVGIPLALIDDGQKRIAYLIVSVIAGSGVLSVMHYMAYVRPIRAVERELRRCTETLLSSATITTTTTRPASSSATVNIGDVASTTISEGAAVEALQTLGNALTVCSSHRDVFALQCQTKDFVQAIRAVLRAGSHSPMHDAGAGGRGSKTATVSFADHETKHAPSISDMSGTVGGSARRLLPQSSPIVLPAFDGDKDNNTNKNDMYLE